MSYAIFDKITTECSILKVLWTIENPLEVFSSGEIEFKPSNARGFKFAIRHSKYDDTYRIFFLCPSHLLGELELSVLTGESIFVDYKVLKKITWDTIKKDTWYLLAIIPDNDFRFHYILNDNSFEIKFTITIYSSLKANKELKIPDSQLNLDLEKMLKDGPHADIVIKSVDGKEFNAHKGMLSIRCDVFKALFEHNTTECQTNVIECPCVGEVLKEVLSFIYTDKADVDKNPTELLAAADYYQLIRLKSLCENVLIHKLSTENVIETLQIAELNSAEDLKKSSLEFIKKHRLKFEHLAKVDSDIIKIINEFTS